MVYDKCTFEEKKVFSTFYTHTHFYEIRVTTKNLDCGEILLFGDIYPSIIYSTRVLLIHASALISNLLNVHGTYSQDLD